MMMTGESSQNVSKLFSELKFAPFLFIYKKK